MDYKDFKKPNIKFAPSPFWAINDKLNVEETKRQMKDLIDHGFGGGFFHARHGLITEYMSKEWFDNVKGALDTAKENGGYLWLYDEDLWPSGNAGGRVAGLKDEYRAATIRFEYVPKGDKPADIDREVKCAYRLQGRKGNTPIAYYWGRPMFTGIESNIDSIEIIPFEEAVKDTESERLIIRHFYNPKVGWWSGESYANLLSPEAMDEFIKQTHEKYKEEVGEEFGKAIPGIFTDEPQLASRFNAIAWWDGLPDQYNKNYNRDFWKDLPYMVFDGKEAPKIRLYINRTIANQFNEAFDKKLYDWCEENNLAFTGHYNAEDFIKTQITYHYGGEMAHYRYMHIPGVDHLCRQANGIEDNTPDQLFHTLLTVKQVASAAHQYDRDQALVEIYGVTRHTNSFAEFKWLGEANMALGATFFVPHLTWYSMRGRRKRDYPPVINYQQSYWDDFNKISTYFNSVSNALTSCKPKIDILVIHNIESALAFRKFGLERADISIPTDFLNEEIEHKNLPKNINVDSHEAADALDKDLRDTVRCICNMGYDCDLGDEIYIEEIGKVKGDTFSVGAMDYKVVVVPTAYTFRPSTCDKLYEFAKNGGKVILCGKVADLVDGEPNPNNMTRLLGLDNVISAPQSMVQIQHAINKIYKPEYSLTDLNGKPVEKTLVSRRADEKGYLYYICNSERLYPKSYKLRINNAKGKYIYILDAAEHKIYKGDTITIGNDLIFPFFLNEYDSKLIYVTDEEYTETDKAPVCDCVCPKSINDTTDTFEFELNDDNIAVCDNIIYSLDNGKTWSDKTRTALARVAISKYFKTERALEWQNWVCDAKGIFDGLGGPVKIKYYIESNIDTEARVAFENLNGGKATLNGEELDFNNNIWKFDRSFKTAPVKIKKGTNVFEHSFDFNYKSDVEDIYVYGQFGVKILNKTIGQITEMPKSIKLGSWVDQGFPFYTGSVKYKFNVNIDSDKANLMVNNPVCTLYRVFVNEKKVKDVWFTPYITDISDYIKKGQNKIEIELVSSLQNTFGPLHDNWGDDNFWVHVDPYENPMLQKDSYVLYDYGLLGSVEIIEK